MTGDPDKNEQSCDNASFSQELDVIKTVLDNLTQGMAVVGKDYRVLAFNRHFEEIFQLPFGTVKVGADFRDILKTWADITRQDQQMLDYAIFRLDERTPFEREFSQLILGEPRWCLMTHNPLPGKGFVRTFTDITERKRMEKALRVSEEKYAKIYHLSPDAIDLSHLATGVQIEANQSYLRMFGYSREELVYRSTVPGDLGIWVNQADRDRHIARVKEQGEDRDFEALLRRKDGSIFTGLISSSLLEFNGDQYNQSICRDISESKRAETDLLQSEQKFRALFESLTEGVALHELVRDECGQIRDYRVLDVNPAYQRHTGFDPAFVRGQLATDLYGTPAPPYLEEYSKVALDSNPYSFEAFFSPLGKHFRISVISPRYEQFATVFEDITERKQVEVTLRETNAYLENLINYANAPIIVWDPEFKITRFNHAFEALTGRSEAEVLGKSLELLFPSGLIEKSMDLIRRTLTGERWETVEIKILNLDGAVRTVLWNSATLFASDGITPIATIAQGQEITRRKQAEEALLESNAYLENLTNHANAPIIVWDPEFKITRFNHAFEFLTGRSEADVLGKSLELLFPPALMEQYMALIRPTATGERWETVEITIQHQNGTVRTVLWNSATLFAPDGHTVVATIAQGQDITEQKSQEREREATAQLIALSSTSSDFHGRMADLTAALQGWSECEAVGIRLRSGSDFPYYETRGFPGEFVQAENNLCAYDQNGAILLGMDGNPVLECMCGNILCGRFDPAKPFFTAHGSFWSNNTTALLASTTEADRQARTRNRCNGEGYESVALIPLRNGDQVFGLLQFNDHRLDRFTPDLIARFERMADSLAMSLARRQAQDDLRESEEKYRSLVSDMQVGVIIQGPQTKILLCNPKALELLGLTEDTLLSRTSFAPEWNIIHEDGSPFSGPTLPVPQAVDTRQSIRKTVMGVYNPVRNDRIWLSVDAEPQLNPDGTVKQVVCTFVDITERKQAEEERRILLERMAQIQKLEALGVLVAGVAHNLNNVLAAIMATASLREKLASEAKDLEAYRIIGTACRRGRDVVKSLTQFAQPALSNPTPVELHALITEVRVLLENTTRNRISIVEEFCGEPLWIQADAGSINHAIVNLCLNSLDAMPKGGILAFRTAIQEEGWVEVSVEDSGEGMTPEVLARVMEPFFTTKEVGKGTGLGLSMTHGVIKAHGGTLEISSVVGQGTKVRLRLPRIPTPIVEETIAAPTYSMRPLNVLLVDDDEDVRFLTARMLKNAGHQINSVAGGEEALETLRSGALPDLIILDQNMPRMNGVQTMERIRALHLDVPILISSGQPDIEGWDCFKQPNVAVISKPFEMDELLAKLVRMSLKSESPPKG